MWPFKKKHKTVEVFYQRPDFPEKVKFLKLYHCRDTGVDLKAIFQEAFNTAHPTWNLLDVTVTQT